MLFSAQSAIQVSLSMAFFECKIIKREFPGNNLQKKSAVSECFLTVSYDCPYMRKNL